MEVGEPKRKITYRDSLMGHLRDENITEAGGYESAYSEDELSADEEKKEDCPVAHLSYEDKRHLRTPCSKA